MVLVVSRSTSTVGRIESSLSRQKKDEQVAGNKIAAKFEHGRLFPPFNPPRPIPKTTLTARPFGDKWIFSRVREARRACLPWRSVHTFHPVDRILARLKMSAHQKLPYKPHR
jgi:hypothetical protein